MKRCPNCNKEYINGNYCTICGTSLVEDEIKFDIFGDPINQVNEKPTVEIVDENYQIIVESDNFVARDRNIKAFSKFISLISIGSLFVPLYGSIISLAALIISLVIIKKDNKHLPYFIISLITLILSIIFFALLLRSGVLTDILNQATTE